MYKLNKKQKIFMVLIILILLILGTLYFYNRDKNNESELIEYGNETEEKNDSNDTKEENKVEKSKEIIVHISGAVKTEGIQLLQEGDRIKNAIDKAGGLNDNADISKINLAFILEDGMKIYIPTKGENENKTNQINSNDDNTQKYIESSKDPNNGLGVQNSKKVNINNASQTDLETLSGIGPSTALKIIKYREENGKFKTIEDIKNVSGIGDAKFNNIKDSITL